MIEHPVITQTERTGYPFPVREQTTCCQDCGRELTGSDLIFDWDGDQICEECCKAAIEENFSFLEIAEALSITAKCAEDI